MLVYGKYECFVNPGRGWKRRPYGRGITALWVAMSVSLCFPHAVAVSFIIIYRGLCASTEMF